MNEKFFDAIRPHFGQLTTQQITGMESVIKASSAYPVSFVAYLLATARHETGDKFAPVVENLNYSVDGLLKTFSRSRISTAEAKMFGRSGSRPANQTGIANTVYGGKWGAENLGNSYHNDGWNFRGRGYVQITGRTNYERASKKTGVDLINNPDKALDPAISAQILVAGCTEGWFTGKKLSDYLPGDYLNARRVVNGTDKADLISGYARQFEKALTAAGYGAVQPKVDQAPAKHWLVSLINAIFGGRK